MDDNQKLDPIVEMEQVCGQLIEQWLEFGISQTDLDQFIAIQDRMRKKMKKARENAIKINLRNKKS